MKKLIVGVFIATTFAATAQTKKPVPPKPPISAKKPTPPASKAPLLKDINDSASYAIGLSVANFYTQQGLTQINADIVAKAINDVLGKKTVLLTDNDANNTMMTLMNRAQQAKSEGNITAGEAFLAQNKTKAGIKTTESGLQYEVIKEGTGPKPAETDSVTVNYKGSLITGEEFDNSYKRGEPITFPLNGVIRGWTEGLQLMPEGSTYKFYIPHQLAYGTREAGSIPGGSVLIFEVELLKVDKSAE